jgi:hypothetical protein
MMPMNKLAWCAATLVVLGAGAAGLGGTACTVTSSSGDDGGFSPGYDAGNQDVTQGDDSGQPHNGTGPDAQSDAGACTEIGTNNPTCDSCVRTSCNAQMCACTGDPTVDDAGFPQCVNDVQCIVDCVAGNPDAGVAPGTPSECESACGSSYSATENQNAAALVSCLAANCAQQCPQ